MTVFPTPGSTDIALSRRTHERVAGRRTDEVWLAERWTDPATRVLVLAGGRFAVERGGTAVRWVAPDQSPDGLRLLLGEQGGRVHIAVVPTGIEAPEEWATLRTAAPVLSAEDAGLVVHAQALAEWHRSHRFCPRCAAALRSDASGHELTCTGCGRKQFPRTDPAVIMLVTDGDRALLGRQPSWPEGRYSTLAGFVEPGESLEDAVAREVMEEVGVAVTEVTYYGNQPWPFPASLMIGFYARATTTDIDVDGEEIEEARWFTRDQLLDQTRAGEIGLPSQFSISRSLIEAWYGAPLPGQW